jgi:hypothetical protein
VLICLPWLGRADGQVVASSSVEVVSAVAGSRLMIHGATTIGARWHCATSDIESRLALVPRAIGTSATLPDVRGVTIHVPVTALRCQSGAMERAMRRALKADRDSTTRQILGRFEIADDIPPPVESERILVGTLRVAGVERNLFLRATVALQPDGALVVRTEVPLRLSHFEIEAPRVLFGAIRARDAITVEVDLRYPGETP